MSIGSCEEEMITMSTMIAAPADERTKSVDKPLDGRGLDGYAPPRKRRTC